MFEDYIVMADETGHFRLIKFNKELNSYADVIDKVSRQDYPEKVDAKKYFGQLYNIKFAGVN